MQWLKSILNGKEELWKIFWGYGLILVVIFYGVCVSSNNITSRLQTSTDLSVGTIENLPRYVLIILLSLVLAWYHAVWRCSDTARQPWKYLARRSSFYIFIVMTVIAVTCVRR